MIVRSQPCSPSAITLQHQELKGPIPAQVFNNLQMESLSWDAFCMWRVGARRCVRPCCDPITDSRQAVLHLVIVVALRLCAQQPKPLLQPPPRERPALREPTQGGCGGGRR